MLRSTHQRFEQIIGPPLNILVIHSSLEASFPLTGDAIHFPVPKDFEEALFLDEAMGDLIASALCEGVTVVDGRCNAN